MAVVLIAGLLLFGFELGQFTPALATADGFILTVRGFNSSRLNKLMTFCPIKDIGPHYGPVLRINLNFEHI